MIHTLGRLRARILGISPAEASFARRGFRAGDEAARRRLEQIGTTFLKGYHAALGEEGPEAVARRLNEIDAEGRGFAFEGAAMGLTLLDHLLPIGGGRMQEFLDGPGFDHVYMIHVGTGWALARLPWLRRRVDRPIARLDPLLRWLSVDGFGFHEGYFSWRRSVVGRSVPRGLSGYAHRAFDQGLGRSLWFVEGADVSRIPATIATFPWPRRADLWSGVGLACAYAGGVDRSAIETLRRAASASAPHLAQGVAFAAQARRRAGNPAAHTNLACELICGTSADVAAEITDRARERLPADGEEPAYEVWRRRIRGQFARETVRT